MHNSLSSLSSTVTEYCLSQGSMVLTLKCHRSPVPPVVSQITRHVTFPPTTKIFSRLLVYISYLSFIFTKISGFFLVILFKLTLLRHIPPFFIQLHCPCISRLGPRFKPFLWYWSLLIKAAIFKTDNTPPIPLKPVRSARLVQVY